MSNDLTILTVLPRSGFGVWLHSLRQLFPKGLLWNWPLADESNIEPTGVPTVESFGVPILEVL